MEAKKDESRIFSGRTPKGRAIPDRHRPGVVRLAGVLAGLFGAGLFVGGCGRQEVEDVSAGFSDPEEWETYKSSFITGDGRVLDNANENITHSEGVGYALLLATHYDDSQIFARVWKWSNENLRVRDDGLFAWRWQPSANEGAGGVDDFNNATDGDILIAWALLNAAERWSSPNYHREAMAIITRIRGGFGRRTSAGLMLLPGEHGFEKEDGNLTVNPSYWVFPALEAFARADETAPEFWLELIASGVRLIRESRFGGPAGLTADWLAVTPGGTITLPDHPQFPAEFGYNAVRVPLYLAWSGFDQKNLHENFARFPRRSRLSDGRPAAVWNLRSESPGPDPAMPGAMAIFEISRAIFESDEPDPARIPALGESDAYYSASLLLLCKMALDQRDQ